MLHKIRSFLTTRLSGKGSALSSNFQLKADLPGACIAAAPFGILRQGFARAQYNPVNYLSTARTGQPSAILEEFRRPFGIRR
jgi:hypothetical protein